MILAGTSYQFQHVSRPLMLGAITASPRTARTAARSLLIEWDLTDLTEPAELIVTELVSNAVQVSADHVVPPPVQLRLSAARDAVLVEVWDCDPRHPVIQQPTGFEERGRGLLLVATLSAQWGWTGFKQGKTVWAEVRKDDDMSAAGCSCGFTELADEEMIDRLLLVFEPDGQRGTDGLIHEEHTRLACACGLTFATPEEFDAHLLGAFTPPDNTGRDGRKHVPETGRTPE